MKKRMKALVKIFKATLCLAIAGCVMAACSDDENIFQPRLPQNGGSPVMSIEHLGTVPSCFDWTFYYSGQYMTQAVGMRRDPEPENDRSYSYTSSLSYGEMSVGIKNSSKENVSVRLNALGYIQTMEVGNDTYNFNYDLNGYMMSWEKISRENSFGQVQQFITRATITFRDGNLEKVEYTEPDDKPVVITFTSATLPNMNGLLPATTSKELGCLGFEHLYYAGLLGRSTANLVKSVHYDFSDGVHNDYTTEYEYSVRNGNTVLCNYHNEDGNVASVKYGY